MSRNAACLALGILVAAFAGPLSSQRLVPDDTRECKRPQVPPFTSVSLPKLQRLFPLSRLTRAYQLVLVVESPPRLLRRMVGTLSLGVFDSTPGRRAIMSPAGFKLDPVQVQLMQVTADSVPRASMDSSLLSAAATVDQRGQTMTIGLGLTGSGELQSPLAVLFVTDVRNGITGLWVSQGGGDPDALRGFFCAFPK
jgi:hypothetical protein